MSTAVRFHDKQRYVVALARLGRTKLHLVIIDEAVRVVTVDKAQIAYAKPLLYGKVPYPVARMVKQFRTFGKVRGITKAAEEELRLAMKP